MTDADRKVQELTTSVGSIAEITALYFKTLKKNGVPEEAAQELTKTFIISLITNYKSSQND